MTLLELCEPLFQYVCRLERLGRSGRSVEMTHVLSEIKGLFKQMQADASSDAHLLNQYEKVELPLIFFVDFMVNESGLDRASEWATLAYERNELAGDEKFFDLLDAELADPGQDAAERLVIYHTCLGLGFTGIYTGQAESIRRLMLKIAARISTMIDADERAYVCPEAYDHVDTRNLIEPPGTKLVGIGIALVGLVVVWFVTCLFLYSWASGEVSQTVDKIQSTRQLDTAGSNP